MLLLDGMPEGTADAAAAWCEEQGVESLAELREAEMEGELIAALPLKPAKAKILRKRLRTGGDRGTGAAGARARARARARQRARRGK